MVNKQQELELLIRSPSNPTRREFLRDVGLGGLAIALEDMLIPRLLQAQFAVDHPVYGPRIKADFEAHRRDGLRTGQMFKFLGIDYDVPIGTVVVAAADGPILNIEHRKIGGPSIWQEHGNGYISFYTHLREEILDRQRQYVGIGQHVKRGQQIATNGTYGGEHVHYGFGRLFSGEEVMSGIKTTLWIDPNTLGEGNGRLKFHTGNPIADKTPEENKIYYRHLVERVLSEFKGGETPDGLKPYFEKNILWPSEVVAMLKDYGIHFGNYFPEDTSTWFRQQFKRMIDPNLTVPVVLTHPIKNPALK